MSTSSDVLRKHCTKCPERHEDEHLPRLARGRKPKACRHCARSKVTCDMREPCGRCCARRLTCSYARTPSDSPTASHDSISPDLSQRESDSSRTGAMFLLSLTNPAAATMLESFTDDDPSELPGLAATVDAGEVLGQEDIFLKHFEDFMMEMGQAEMDDADVLFPSGDLFTDLASPIFRPEALAILQTKTETVVNDLHQLHQSLAAYDACYRGSFDRPTAKEVLGPESIIRFAATYFHLSHHHIPIVHRPSFGLPETSTALLLAVALAGALRSPPRDDALSVRALARLFEEYTFLRLADIMSTHEASVGSLNDNDLLGTVQAAILVNNVQFMNNDVATRRRIRTQRLPALVATVRRLGLFAMRHSPDTDWAQHVQEQSCIR